MTDPDAAIPVPLLNEVRRASVSELGFVYDPLVVTRMQEVIVARIRRGDVGEGITYAQLVRDARAPSWVAHRGLLGHILALVSVKSYEDDGVLLGALVRVREADTPPTADFCQLLKQLGVVRSRHHREDCLELWDHHWKLAVSQLDRAVS